MAPLNPSRPWDITIAAALMILFGLAEVVTGFTHNFFGIITSSASIFGYSSALIGLFYAAAGALILTMKKSAATLAIALLVADIVGRIILVVTGLYPADTLKNTFSIIAGTIIVAVFTVYVGLRRKSFT